METMGRNRKEIDETVLVSLAERGWSMRAIAATFGVSEGLIRKRYSAKVEESRHVGAYKLLDILWQRGVKEKSDKVLLNLAERIIGPTPKAQDPNTQQGPVNIQVNQYNPQLSDEECEQRVLELNQKLLTKGEE